MQFVFVYGSLKQKFHNNHLMKGDGSSFIALTTTVDKYDMASFGSFPAVVEKLKDFHIKGEVYYVDDDVLKTLDHLEGNGSFYQRKLINVKGFSDVWCYFLIVRYPNDIPISQDGIRVTGDVKEWINGKL